MTIKQQTQYDRFLSHGYSPDLAAQLIERGTWLEAIPMSAQDVATVREYRAEREASAGEKEDGHGVDAA